MFLQIIHLGGTAVPQPLNIGPYKTKRVAAQLTYSCENYWVLNGLLDTTSFSTISEDLATVVIDAPLNHTAFYDLE